VRVAYLIAAIIVTVLNLFNWPRLPWIPYEYGGPVGIFRAGMTVGEFSSPLLKGPQGKFVPGTGQIEAAVKKLRAVMDEASDLYRDGQGLKK
jgi:hypothetical protein